MYSLVAACAEEDAYMWLITISLSGCQEYAS